MRDHGLLVDIEGKPLHQRHRTYSADWDEVRGFCDKTYMPFRVRPLGIAQNPDATMYSARVGRVTATHFCYGVPVYLNDFDPDAGNLMVLTTLEGGIEHMVDAENSAFTSAGESFVVDCSRSDYWLKANPDHLQINLTIPHDVVAEHAMRYFGGMPDDRLWRCKLKFGGGDTAWFALLHYMAASIREAPSEVEAGRIGRHLEETLCLRLLEQWCAGAGVTAAHATRFAVPYYVKRAEDFIRNHAFEAPTLSDIAAASGVSVRTLSWGFKKFRTQTPAQCLRHHRLQGVRAVLLAAGPDETVSSIASLWGYVNFGIFARSYQNEFGELPSKTLRRPRHH